MYFYDEDEMLQLASEMSLYDVAESLWTDTDYQETSVALYELKEILAVAEKDLEISKEKEPWSHDTDERSSFELTFEAPKPVLPSMIRDNLVAPEASPRTPCYVRRKGAAEKANELQVGTVLELVSRSAKLLKLKLKLSKAIERSGAGEVRCGIYLYLMFSSKHICRIKPF